MTQLPLRQSVEVLQPGAIRIRYMLNSHHHGDHVSGNANFQQLGVDIIAQQNIRRRRSNTAR